MKKSFASKADLEKKKITFKEIGKGAYAYTAEGDPNSGVIIGDDAVMVIEAQATPHLANDVIRKIRTVTDKPIKYLVLSHYHAVRVLGYSAYEADEIIMSEKTLEMVNERGREDWKSEFQRFPRLFEGHQSIKGLCFPTISFKEKIRVDLGNKTVEIIQIGEGHTKGDTVVWIPEEKILFAGDLVENGATPYCGDAQLEKWPQTLEAILSLNPNALVPGRGEAVLTASKCTQAIEGTKNYVTTLFEAAKEAVAKGKSLKEFHDDIIAEMRPKFGDWFIFEHCMCFNASRAYDEAKGIDHPLIWTEQKDLEMWEKLNA